MTIYAKSDGTTLRDHSYHVMKAMEAVARPLLPDITDAEYNAGLHGAMLHDVGKAHPAFQESLCPGFDEAKRRLEVPHRHEISSILFLPLFERDDWPLIVDMVIAHHKSVRALGGQRGRGLIDLVDEYGEDAVFHRHSEQCERWAPDALTVLSELGVKVRPITLPEMRCAFDEALRLCETERYGRNRWRGLLMSADHLASALQDETEGRVGRLFKVPDLTKFEDRAAAASSDLYPLAKRLSNSPKPHTLVVAPTGSGKTDFLLRRCQQGRVFYLLPFQASINAMFLRMESLLNGTGEERLPEERRTDIRRVHASAQIEIDGGVEEETVLQRHPGASLKVMTPHQLASLVFGLAGYEAVALDVQGQNVILDEVHVYGEQAQAMVLALVRLLVRLECNVHIGSATIPSALANEILLGLGGRSNVYEVRLTERELTTYDRHVVHLLTDEAAARDYVRQKLNNGERVLFISNRVATAQDRYRWARDAFPDIPALLVHSRFRRVDRASIEKQIQAFDNSPGPCIVCSTQVIEVSLDISFDTLVTDCAPLDSLIQRFGRVNRRRLSEGSRRLVPVGVISPPASEGDAKPYDLDVLRRTWGVLPAGKLLPEVRLQTLIDAVYPSLDMTEIDVHLVETESGSKLLELCNFPRSLLLDVLDVDSAVVVCASDLE